MLVYFTQLKKISNLSNIKKVAEEGKLTFNLAFQQENLGVTIQDMTNEITFDKNFDEC